MKRSAMCVVVGEGGRKIHIVLLDDGNRHKSMGTAVCSRMGAIRRVRFDKGLLCKQCQRWMSKWTVVESKGGFLELSYGV